MKEASTAPAAQRILTTAVAAEWVDYNGHMNDAAYALVFSQAVDALMATIGLDDAGRERHAYTLYTLETHLCYRREAYRDQPLTVEVVLIDRDAKRLHAFFSMLDAKGRMPGDQRADADGHRHRQRSAGAIPRTGGGAHRRLATVRR